MLLRHGSKSWPIRVVDNVMQYGWDELCKMHRIGNGYKIILFCEWRWIFNTTIFDPDEDNNEIVYRWSEEPNAYWQHPEPLQVKAKLAICIWFKLCSIFTGATVGSFTGGTLADKFGRTRTFQLDAIPLAVGAFLCATAQSVQTLIIGRLLARIGIGISSAIVPLNISEISPTEIRGTLGSIRKSFMVCISCMIPRWRTMFGIAIMPSVLLALEMAFSPESPRWLYQQGKFSEAEMAIKRLFGKERVAEVMNDFSAASQGSPEPEGGCTCRIGLVTTPVSMTALTYVGMVEGDMPLTAKQKGRSN
ncbi:hypothetical protein RHSIM_Rhsim09G0027700 [Rhododendron simsii]|uniref:Major facilitator superfamily (MFS) profile domain-containing protein n=1 Tax=Rhododendron simsii TaxID=118357 RepID=A0A834GIW2_RHOSS|nr:hypothetical protein RHSIM_Rhsim09G0027700 [Rhododendron simsii]